MFLVYTRADIGVRRTFERPKVVGVRGVLVKIDVNHPGVFVGDTENFQRMKLESFATNIVIKLTK
jgi:hypothetical protein